MKTALIAGAFVASIATISIIAAVYGGDADPNAPATQVTKNDNADSKRSSGSKDSTSSDGKAESKVTDDKKLLDGKRFTPEGSSMSFVVPTGWQTGWVNQGGEQVFAAEPASKRGTIFATARPLDAEEKKASIDQLLRAAIQELVGGVAAETVSGPTTTKLNGNPAGQLIVRVKTQGKHVELNASGVVIDGWGIAFLGAYEIGAADEFRPAVDTMFWTLEGTPPEAPKTGGTTPGGRSIIGCWEHYYSSGGMSQTRISFAADGTYWYHHYTSIGGASNESREEGRYSVTGNVISTRANDGTTGSYTVEWDRAIAYLNGTKYLPCS